MNKKLFTFTNDVPAKGSSLLFRHFQEREQSVKNFAFLPLLAKEKKKRLRAGLQCIKHGLPRAARWGLWWFALF
jgi:hypothetical protein